MKKLALIGLLVLFAAPASATMTRILPTADAWPVWSPDGSQIAFTRISGNTMTLEVLSLGRGYGVQVVARNRGQLGESWSSDSSQLAYTAGGRVYVWNRADSSRTPHGVGIEPALSPDGAHVAALRGTSLYVDGVQWFAGAIGHPEWSPDGRRLAFAREGGITVASGPGVLDFTAPTRAEPGSPVWSPDGKTLAYTDANRVWVARVDGSRASKAVSPQRANISPLSWSRAGHAIIYTRRGAVEVSRVDGRTSVLVPTTGLGAAFDPQQERVAFAGPRPACPGHVAIRLYFYTPYSTSLTGTCLVLGTAKADEIEGSLREGDVIRAGAGNDRVHGNDGHTDRIDCGAGRDTVWADRLDKLAHCEIVHR